MLQTISNVMIRADTARETILTEPVILGLIGLFGAIVTAYLAYLGVKTKVDRDQQASDRAQQAADRARIEALEGKLEDTERRNMGLWTYCRILIDHIYRGKGAPPPDPPEHIKNLFD
ncbi:hypothetical protein [Glutamicibacter soli]